MSIDFIWEAYWLLNSLIFKSRTINSIIFIPSWLSHIWEAYSLLNSLIFKLRTINSIIFIPCWLAQIRYLWCSLVFQFLWKKRLFDIWSSTISYSFRTSITIFRYFFSIQIKITSCFWESGVGFLRTYLIIF